MQVPSARGGAAALSAVGVAEAPPAVVLLPGMDGTALLSGQFRSALDPSFSLVVRQADLLSLVSSFFLLCGPLGGLGRMRFMFLFARACILCAIWC